MKKSTSIFTSLLMFLSLIAFSLQPSNAHATILSDLKDEVTPIITKTLKESFDIVEVQREKVNKLDIKVKEAEAHQAVIGPVLAEKMLSTSQALEVIVTFHKKQGPDASDFALLKSVGITTGIGFKSLPMAGVLATPEQIKALATKTEVRSIYYNQQLQYDNYEATNLTGAKEVLKEEAFRKANRGLPVSGKGVTVLVNDSGIDGTHKDLEYGTKVIQNVAAQTNLHAQHSLLPVTYTENIANTDTASHGTHVAGTVGGTGEMSNGLHEGVAPGVNLIGYGSGAVLFILDTMGGFDYALTHRNQYNIRVITNSFGSPSDIGTAFDPEHPTNIATKALYDHGIVVVFSAGNSGPAESTITGNYKKAPWIITVAAGDKEGRLAEFSSRGLEGNGGTVTVDGVDYEWVDRPTVTAPGVNIVSTRAWDSLSAAGLAKDSDFMDPGQVPYYSVASGTSMAAPHIAGVVALILDANPELTPDEVKEILQQTATNIPGEPAWKVGAGYVNAYAAVDAALNREKNYGTTLTKDRDFVEFNVTREPVAIDYMPGFTAEQEFEVKEGTYEVEVTVFCRPIRSGNDDVGDIGNSNYIRLVAPDGTTYSSGLSSLFVLYHDRSVVVKRPMAGTWKIEVIELGAALPELVEGTLTIREGNNYNVNDINDHVAANAIQTALEDRLVYGYEDGTYKPDQNITRSELAEYLTLGGALRQYLPAVDNGLNPYENAAMAGAGSLRDWNYSQNAVMLAVNNDNVTRAELAYSLVQSLGLQAEAEAFDAEYITVAIQGETVNIEDTDLIDEKLRGYVQVALNKGLMWATFDPQISGDFKTGFTINYNGTFAPNGTVTRAEYAISANKMYEEYMKVEE